MSSRSALVPVLSTLLIPLFLLLLGFPWYADLLAYPFRMLNAGPNQPYGTWTGIVHVEPKEIAKDTDRSRTEYGKHFAAALVTVGLPVGAPSPVVGTFRMSLLGPF